MSTHDQPNVDENNVDKILKQSLIRLFIAIEPPDVVKEELIRCQQQLRKLNFKGSYPKPNTMHLTLLFLGEQATMLIPAISAMLHKVSSEAFSLTLDGINHFSHRGILKVIWISLLGEGIYQLHHHLQVATSGLGLKHSGPFIPHLTLLRAKGMREQESRLEKLDRLLVNPVAFEVHKFSLFKSERLQRGVVHQLVEEFRFS